MRDQMSALTEWGHEGSHVADVRSDVLPWTEWSMKAVMLLM